MQLHKTIPSILVFIITLLFFTNSSLCQDTNIATHDTIEGIKPDISPGFQYYPFLGSLLCMCRYYNKTSTITLKDIINQIKQLDSTIQMHPDIYLKPFIQVSPKIIEMNCPGTKAEFKSGVLPVVEVKKQIDAQRIFLYIIKWNASGYHPSVITGCKDVYRVNKMDSCLVYAHSFDGSGCKSWKKYTDKGMAVGQGSFGCLVVTQTQSTDVVDQQQIHTSKQPLTFAVNQTNHSKITFSISGMNQKTVLIQFFTLKGVCVYKNEAFIPSNQTTFSVPFYGSAGLYMILCQTKGTIIPVTTKGIMKIVK